MFLFLFIRINICWQYVFVLTHDTDTIIRSHFVLAPPTIMIARDNHYQHSGKEASEASGITQYNAAVVSRYNSIGRGK